MKLRLVCPECRQWTATSQVDAAAWPCAHCGFEIAATAPGGAELSCCRVCGNHELYVQKDFPHWLGMGILVAACVFSAVTYYFYWIWATWIILVGSAIVDGALYIIMGNVTVCYRCLAQYRGFPPNPAHQAFDLAVGEKYRQEKLRREQLGNSLDQRD
jgi:hypothetical protein